MSQIPPKGPFSQGISAASMQAIKSAQAAFLSGLQPESAAAPTPDPVVESSGSIIDAAGNVWTLVGSQVAVNDVVDPTTSDVIELYYDGVFWQANSAGSWWSKAAPTDPWKPETGPPTQ